MSTDPENLVTIGLVGSEIPLLQAIVKEKMKMKMVKKKEKKESNSSKTYVRQVGRQAGGLKCRYAGIA